MKKMAIPLLLLVLVNCTPKSSDTLTDKDSSTNTNTLRPVVSQPEAKSEVVTYSMLDYGYGTSDAATVTVGTQEWISKNLNVTNFANGDAIPEAKTADEWTRAGEDEEPVWCYYDNDPANGSTYGKLYNWYAVSDPRGLAPKGWHIPSDEEWTALTDYLGGETTAGLKMKSASGWNNNGNGNNNSGLAGLPGGTRLTDMTSFYYIGSYGYWWSSSYSHERTGEDEGTAWYRALSHDDGSAGRSESNMADGLSVRCLRDSVAQVADKDGTLIKR